MINKAEAWQDQEIYYAVIDTPQGGIWRLFSFDCELTKAEMIQQIMDYFPGALSVRNLDSWGTAYSLSPALVAQPSSLLNEIEQQFKLIQQMISSEKATLYRDLMNELELAFEQHIFSESNNIKPSIEGDLYTKIKTARDLAFYEETTGAY